MKIAKYLPVKWVETKRDDYSIHELRSNEGKDYIERSRILEDRKVWFSASYEDIWGNDHSFEGKDALSKAKAAIETSLGIIEQYENS